MNLADLLAGDPVEVAPQLLGCLLTTRFEGEVTSVRLTEVEAYREDDPASHSYRGRTPRTETMFGRAGLLYVYRSYGIHWCANVVCGAPGSGAAVLLRAGEPQEGRTVMERRRGRADHLSDGPGKLCSALGITGDHDGTDVLAGGPIQLEPGPAPAEVIATPRIGISKAVDRPWRFVAAG